MAQAPFPIDYEPPYRRLNVYAIDPALALQVDTLDVATAKLPIRWRDLQGPGPVGDYVEVIDMDPSSGCFYQPIDLSMRKLLATDGLAPTESDPRFHQQMAYAVSMNTIQTFEAALGRCILWSPRRLPQNGAAPAADGKKQKMFEYVDKLRIYPHAFRGTNAYYDPDRKALLFGYFPASSNSQSTMKGGFVFSALSFDIVAHETTHAILDGLHRRYIEDTNGDMLAFHEAFADIVALFQHFSLSDFLEFQVASSRGNLEADLVLAKLAVQFGQGTGHYGALRSAIADENGKRKDPKDFNLDKVTEPHARGAILVSAVFDAFLAIYKKRTADLFRIASNGTGVLQPGAIHPDLVKRLATEASKVAGQILRMCVRAVDYMPPVDITFGDYLRAILTADYDVLKNDRFGYRVAFIEAFQKWGIQAGDVSTLGEQTLIWDRFAGLSDDDEITGTVKQWIHDDFRPRLDEKVQEHNRLFYRDWKDVDPEGPRSLRHAIYEWSEDTARLVHLLLQDFKSDWPDRIAAVFGLEPPLGKIEVHAVRPLLRNHVDDTEQPSTDLVVIVTQKLLIDPQTLEPVPEGESAPGSVPMTFRGGATIIYDLRKGDFKYVIRKSIASKARRERQRDHQFGNRLSIYFNNSSQPFRMLHEVDL